MAIEKRKQSRGSDTAYRGGGDERSSGVQKLLRRAPRFSVLAKAAARQGPELSRSQQEFLDDFAGRLAEGVAEDDDASSTSADVDGKGEQSRGT